MWVSEYKETGSYTGVLNVCLFVVVIFFVLFFCFCFGLFFLFFVFCVPPPPSPSLGHHHRTSPLDKGWVMDNTNHTSKSWLQVGVMETLGESMEQSRGGRVISHLKTAQRGYLFPSRKLTLRPLRFHVLKDLGWVTCFHSKFFCEGERCGHHYK